MGSGNKPRISLERDSSSATQSAQAAADESGARRKSERSSRPKDVGNNFSRGFAAWLKRELRCESAGGCRGQVFSKRAQAFWAFCLGARGTGPRTEGPQGSLRP